MVILRQTLLVFLFFCFFGGRGFDISRSYVWLFSRECNQIYIFFVCGMVSFLLI